MFLTLLHANPARKWTRPESQCSKVVNTQGLLGNLIGDHRLTQVSWECPYNTTGLCLCASACNEFYYDTAVHSLSLRRGKWGGGKEVGTCLNRPGLVDPKIHVYLMSSACRGFVPGSAGNLCPPFPLVYSQHVYPGDVCSRKLYWGGRQSMSSAKKFERRCRLWCVA